MYRRVYVESVTRGTFCEWNKFYHFWKSLGLFCGRHNWVFHNGLAAYNAAATGGITLFFYCSLTAYDALPWYIYIAFPVLSFFGIFIFSVVHPFMTMWYRRSRRVLVVYQQSCRLGFCEGGELLGDKFRTRIRLRELRACRPIGVENGGFGVVKAGTYQDLIEQIFTCLLLLIYCI